MENKNKTVKCMSTKNIGQIQSFKCKKCGTNHKSKECPNSIKYVLIVEMLLILQKYVALKITAIPSAKYCLSLSSIATHARYFNVKPTWTKTLAIATHS